MTSPRTASAGARSFAAPSLRGQGVRIREYRVPHIGSVNCTFDHAPHA